MANKGEPLRQQIPLSDTIRKLSGDSGGLVRELKKERLKLEREIKKSLETVGRVDSKLVGRLDDLKRREVSAGFFADRDSARERVQRESSELRSRMGKVGGVMELAAGRVQINNLEDLGDILQDTGAALAKGGMTKWGNRLSNIGMAVASGVAKFAVPVFAGLATFEAGFLLGKTISHAAFGDPDEMKRKAYQRSAALDMLDAARERMQHEQWVKLAQRAVAYDDPAAIVAAVQASDAQTMLSGAAWERINDIASRKAKVTVYPWSNEADVNRRLAEEREKHRAELAQAEASAATEKIRKYRSDPATIRDRAIARERILFLRSVEDAKWSGQMAWGTQ